MAASRATPEKVAFMIRHTSGILCTPILEEDAKRLHLDPMVARNDAPMSTAFTVSIDYRHGLTTGISAEERANTIQALANGNVGADDFVRPGHIFPLVARTGGVLVRSGHTEAGVDLATLAGLPPVGLLAEIVNDDGTVKRLPQLLEFAAEHKLKITSIADLITYRQRREHLVERVREFSVNTSIGPARAFAYKTKFEDAEHLALVFGRIDGGRAAAVRIHREKLIEDIFGPQGDHPSRVLEVAIEAHPRSGRRRVHLSAQRLRRCAARYADQSCRAEPGRCAPRRMARDRRGRADSARPRRRSYSHHRRSRGRLCRRVGLRTHAGRHRAARRLSCRVFERTRSPLCSR